MKLIGVTDDRHSNEELAVLLERTEPYIDRFILREKSKTDEQLTQLVENLRSAGFPAGKLILHARPRLAETLCIEEVQLTGYGMSLQEAQSAYPTLRFGRSVHSLKEAQEAEIQGAGWLLYGHIYATSSKEGLDPRGTDELYAIAASCRVPVYAIGGIKPRHLSALSEHGIAGAAVLSPLRDQEALKEYRKGVVLDAEDN